MKILDQSKTKDLLRIQEVMEGKRHKEMFDFCGIGTQARVYVSKCRKYAIKLFHQIEDEVEIDEAARQDGVLGFLCYDYDAVIHCESEVQALKHLNEAGCPHVPQLYAYQEGEYLIKEFIDGLELESFCVLNDISCFEDMAHHDKEREFYDWYHSQINDFLSFCESLNLNPRDWFNRENIIITDDGIKIIDLAAFRFNL